MDNLTHTLFGAALAGAAIPDEAAPSRRRLFYAAGIVAANLPDLDLVYTSVTPAPLGYLLHHRGHTHTLVALAVQWVILAAVGHALPAGRGLGVSSRRRLWTLLAAGLLSHVLLDFGNSYGVHPFFPFDNRWVYGDAVFIFEPWLWLLLGIPVALTARRRGIRIALLGLLAGLPVALAAGTVVPWPAVAALLLAALGLGAIVSRLSRRGRPLAALAASTGFVVVLFGLSHVAQRQVRDLLRPSADGEVVDVVLTPDPANPWCWSVIAIEKYEAASEYLLRPATLSLFPGLQPPTTCASHRFGGERPFRDVEGRMAAYAEIRQSLPGLRARAGQDCAAAAWLQFGRAPVIDDGRIFDLRFEARGGNFTAMALRSAGEGSPCPPHLTRWVPPRADLLGAR